MVDLRNLGWDADWAAEFAKIAAQGSMPGRISRVDKGSWRVLTTDGEYHAGLSGRLRHAMQGKGELPAVGDWVALALSGDRGVIQAVLPRRTRFARKESISGGRKVRTINGRERVVGGATEEQVVAANIDTVFLVSALDQTFNLRRIEVYLTFAHDSGAEGVIVLNKADLCDDAQTKLSEVAAIAGGHPVHVVSAETGQGLEQLHAYLKPGVTVALLGPSGAGKSSIINSLSGAGLLTGKVRDNDHKGRHTTTWQELVFLPAGGILVDTAGMRKLLLWSGEEGVQEVFADIEELVSRCRFRNCQHKGEPGCAIRQALNEGTLDQERFDTYGQLKAESAYMAQRREQKARKEGRRS